ncbi:iron-containing alcohol dehydrogenase [Anoxynatronum buryatiense]|uniref:Alcohol dehydrogenase n=1 Tax=Anoxynatronum buryatiense TaxID=489973 RepID=A0AA45WYE5_9CLOT|nr:iron-containing alcohol dehydrogenase [Anoxynatronum buryatiense]SMP67913.1 alcohol dehydrogenase [Anoxynatronum buryatiense]
MLTTTKPFTFTLPTDIHFGPGVVKELPGLLKSEGIRQVLVVTDPGIIKASLLDVLDLLLTEAAVNYAVYEQVSPNPRDTEVETAARMGRETGAQAVIALGGGSPIDCAKAVNVLLSLGEERIKPFEGKGKVPRPLLPLYTIPTTSGTGSEVTFSSVINDTLNQYKMTVKSPYMAPRAALVDPEMTLDLPGPVTAATGMDALTHAIEAYTVNVANPISDALALQATELISASLVKAYQQGDHLEARSAMMLGSLLAGLAFSHSDVGAVHCMAESLGGRLDLPHGLCNAILLPYVMAFNQPACTARYARLAQAMGCRFSSDEAGAAAAISRVKELSQLVELPPFSHLRISPDDFEEMAALSANNISTESNPRPMTKEDYLAVFQHAYAGNGTD